MIEFRVIKFIDQFTSRDTHFSFSLLKFKFMVRKWRFFNTKSIGSMLWCVSSLTYLKRCLQILLKIKTHPRVSSSPPKAISSHISKRKFHCRSELQMFSSSLSEWESRRRRRRREKVIRGIKGESINKISTYNWKRQHSSMHVTLK